MARSRPKPSSPAVKFRFLCRWCRREFWVTQSVAGLEPDRLVVIDTACPKCGRAITQKRLPNAPDAIPPGNPKTLPKRR